MQERKASWPWLLAGLLGLGSLGWLMTYTGTGSAKNMINSTRSLAQDGLDTAGFSFVRAEVDGTVLKLVGRASDKPTADAACKAAKDKVAGRIGMPGVFSRIDCAGMTDVGSDTAAPSGLKGSSLSAATVAATAATAAISEATNIDATSCQVRLTQAGKSGTVVFARSKGEVLAGQDLLDRVAAVAQECSKFAIEVGGHTDTGGAAALNQRLSARRANVVRAYLISKGVSADQITAKGYGESQPLVNDFPNGNADVPGQPDSPLRAQNRRIEFTVTALQ